MISIGLVLVAKYYEKFCFNFFRKVLHNNAENCSIKFIRAVYNSTQRSRDFEPRNQKSSLSNFRTMVWRNKCFSVIHSQAQLNRLALTPQMPCPIVDKGRMFASFSHPQSVSSSVTWKWQVDWCYSCPTAWSVFYYLHAICKWLEKELLKNSCLAQLL